MKFKLLTLADIAHTGAGRQDSNKISYKQEANFQTVLQTIGLRANLEFEKSPAIEEMTVLKMGFGNKYKGKQQVWSFEFNIPFEGAVTLEMLNNDFNLIPFIPDLTETVKFEQAVFRTQDPVHTNIIFEQLDK
jgi:hypothetical protein